MTNRRLATLIALTLVLSLAPGSARAGTAVERGGGHSISWSGFGGGLGNPEQHATVPACVRRGGLGLPAPNPDGEPPDRDELKPYFRCQRRLSRSVEGLIGQFLVAAQDGDLDRACRLLSREERGRLGGVACPDELAGVPYRLREDRQPQVDSYGLSFGGPKLRSMRGDFSVLLVRPFERIGFRFEVERGRLRISNTRDLFREEPDPET